MIMKNILYTLGCAAVMLATSCKKIDNYPGPNASLSGKIMDATDGKPFLTGQGEFSIRLWETSWSDNPTPQDLSVKQDGSYTNTKLFQATYAMQPYGGAFWPTDKIEGFKLGSDGTQDFEVVPYLKVIDVKATVSADHKLHISCRLQAPLLAGLPDLKDVRPFISLTPYVGNGNRIDEYYKDEYRLEFNRNFSELANPATGISLQEFVMPNDIPLLSGRTYYVRMGARVRDTFEKYNYSEVITIKVP